MSQFRTTFEIPGQNLQIDYKSGIFSLGSCFAEHMAEKLNYYLFNIASNPNGIIFNPVSLASNLLYILSAKDYKKDDLVFHNGLWNSWEHHHLVSQSDQDQMLSRINATNQESGERLSKSKVLLVTFGTALAYKYKKTGKVVANCHKLPGQEFEKVRLSQHQIVGHWQDVLDVLFQKYPEMKVIMTVSPVRHIKDGMVGNQSSKATLHLSIDALCRQYERVHYFPSYELMMDDLRDYRFYKSDMIHPNKDAVEYIWNRFFRTYMSFETVEFMKRIDALQQRKAHRPLHPFSKANLVFQEQLKKDWEMLYQEFPFLTTNKE